MDNTQRKVVLNHLQEHGSITSMEAFQRWGITRLSDKILKLRNRGMIIDSIPTTGTNRYGDEVRFSTYRLSSINKKLNGE